MDGIEEEGFLIGPWDRRDLVRSHEGKLVHHRCGHPFWLEVLDAFGPYCGEVVSTETSILVCYKDVMRDPAIVVYQCPTCKGMLKLWWTLPEDRAGSAPWCGQGAL